MQLSGLFAHNHKYAGTKSYGGAQIRLDWRLHGLTLWLAIY